MIYIFTAMYCEAKPLIERFALSPDGDYPFAGFVSEDGNIRLVITGVGKTYSAAAVSYAHAKFGITKDDFAVNIGTCAGGRNTGGAYIINKVTDEDSGRSYYPDMLYKTGLREHCVTTVSDVVSEEKAALDPDMLWEMEASGFSDIARLLMPPDRVQLIKVVSDNGAEGEKAISEELLERVIRESIDDISKAVDLYLSIPADGEENVQEDGTEDLFCCSETMRQDLMKLLVYCRNSGRDVSGIISSMRGEGLIPAADRKSGKAALNEFKRRILQ